MQLVAAVPVGVCTRTTLQPAVPKVLDSSVAATWQQELGNGCIALSDNETVEVNTCYIAEVGRSPCKYSKFNLIMYRLYITIGQHSSHDCVHFQTCTIPLSIASPSQLFPISLCAWTMTAASHSVNGSR